MRRASTRLIASSRISKARMEKPLQSKPISQTRPTSKIFLLSLRKIFGRLGIFVKNAGIYEFVPLDEITEEHFHRHFDLNVLGLLLAPKPITDPRSEIEFHGPGLEAFTFVNSAGSCSP